MSLEKLTVYIIVSNITSTYSNIQAIPQTEVLNTPISLVET